MAGLPERVFYSLSDLQTAWQISSSDIRQWLMHGQIRANVWLPLMSVYEVTEHAEASRVFLTRELRHWEGYTPLYPHHCRTLFKSGKVYLRDFLCPENNSRLMLPDTADSMRFSVDDLVILNDDRKHFEKQYHISETSVCNVKIIGRVGKTQPIIRSTDFDPTFKKVLFSGQKYSFGDIQADIIRQLYEAALTGNPWQNGKQLLAKAGSQSFTLSNIFKRNPLWRCLIISDGRGSYRLDEGFVSSVADHHPITT